MLRRAAGRWPAVTEQLDIFAASAPIRHRVHRADPITSRIAAHNHGAQLERHADQILAVIKTLDKPATGGEIAGRWNAPHSYDWKRSEVGRRTKELESDGKIRRCAPRICEVKGSLQVTWEVVR